MGYFSNEDLMQQKYDREEKTPYNNKEQWIQTIMVAFPQKKYAELINIDEDSLKGMYMQARKKINLLAYKEENNQDVDDERRLGR